MVCQSNLRILCPTYIDLYFLFYHLIHMDMQSLILTVYFSYEKRQGHNL